MQIVFHTYRPNQGFLFVISFYYILGIHVLAIVRLAMRFLSLQLEWQQFYYFHPNI
jgi:hypothetical protein